MIRNHKAQLFKHLLLQRIQKIRFQRIDLPAFGADGMMMTVAGSSAFPVQLVPGKPVVKIDLIDQMQISVFSHSKDSDALVSYGIQIFPVQRPAGWLCLRPMYLRSRSGNRIYLFFPPF